MVAMVADPALREAEMRRLMEIRYSIHFHVWDGMAALDFFTKTCDFLGRKFEIRLFEQSAQGHENIFILEKLRS
ncbi:MAG: hypothetical protein C5B49_02745 [Bdellovibrio sp.]|nr:MAG: hypothetical protein C5B49_02745 [Bdellovibrio sp.]